MNKIVLWKVMGVIALLLGLAVMCMGDMSNNSVIMIRGLLLVMFGLFDYIVVELNAEV